MYQHTYIQIDRRMIDCIRTHRLQHKLEEPFGYSQWHYETRNQLLVEVVSSCGAVGWGECYGPAQVTQTAVHSFYAPLLIGWDPLRNEAAWQHCWRSSLDFARRGIMMGAMSGLDMALLDLRGKLLGVSASELLGGRVRDQVPCYATGMYFRIQPETQLHERLLAEAASYVDRGFQALKIKVGKNFEFDRNLIVTMRESFPDIRLMADSNHAYDLAEATRIGRILEEHNFGWFEEPLSPEYTSQFRQLSDRLNIPIATGECEQTRWGFQQLLESGGVQIAQPDLAYCGGPTEALKIRGIASAHGVNVVPHCWGTQLNLATATHFLATTYVEPGRAEVAEPLLESDQTRNPMREEMFETEITFENACVRVPDSPGLGVEPDQNAMQQFCVQTTECRQ